MHEGGGDCLKYLKRGWNRKDGMGHKNFKKEGKLGQGVGVLKRGAWNPLTNYALILGICDVTLRFCFYIFTAISFPRASD